MPLAIPRVGADNDMVRYMWDGRLQHNGVNPYAYKPVDPAVAAYHTDETRRMPSRRDLTPYPAAAQWFFRLVVTIDDSPRTMKFALVLCDLLTIGVLLRWLPAIGLSPWLALVYAWNPLVILEVAHSGHIDALAAMWIALAAWMLGTKRTLAAALAFTLAVATKLLPIVLLPLFWRRIRLRDALAGAALLALLYLPFASAGTLPLGAVPNVVAVVRFNGPAFRAIANGVSPAAAAVVALVAGWAVAGWMRRRKEATSPEAWALPMAAAVALAPVVYPWYLLSFTPFLFTRPTLPLIVWTYSVLPVYVVWELSRHGHRWVVPAAVMAIEYGGVAAALLWQWRGRVQTRRALSTTS